MNQRAQRAQAPSLRTVTRGPRFLSLSAAGSGAPAARQLMVLTLALTALLLLLLLLLLLASASASAAPPPEFGYQGDGAGGFIEANGIAVDQQSGDVYLGDRNNNRIDQFGPGGEFIRAWGWGVADGTSQELQVCTSVCFAGIGGPGPGQFAGPEGIAVDNDLASPSHGDVYVVDPQNSRIEKFSASGAFLLAFGEAGSGPGQFEGLRGRSIAVGPEGSIYVGDENRVQRLSPNGSPEGQFPVPAAGRIEELAVDLAGDVYLVGSELSGVRKFDPSGTELGEPRDPSAEAFTFTLAIGPGDELFVNEGENSPSSPHHILAFSPSGEEMSSFDSGQESGERGIAYGDAAEAVYVVNAASVRAVPPPPPGPFVVVGSESATEVEPTAAQLTATLNPEGGEETTYFFEYGESEAYGETTAPAELNGEAFEDQPAFATISGLEPRTIYHFRIVAENNAGETTLGPDATFTTLPPASIDSTSASEVTSTSALLEAELNPHGLSTSYYFEYDTGEYQEGEGPHGNATVTAQAGSGSSDKAVAAQLQSLVPATTYHFRLVAENSLGVVQGPDRSFRTQGPPSSFLPDGRSWELVSPPDKNGVSLEALAAEGGTTQAAADGSGIAYIANGAIDAEPNGNASVDFSQLLTRRGPSHWLTEDITTPHGEPSGARPGLKSEYKLFSPDLKLGAVEPTGATPLSPLVGAGEQLPYLRQADGSFTPFAYAGNVPPGTNLGFEQEESGNFFQVVRFVAANPTLSHAVIESQEPLVEGVNSGPVSLYDWSGGTLSLISEIPAEGASRCGGGGPACVPAANESVTTQLGEFSNGSNRNAMSADGKRFVFQGQDHLFLRDSGQDESVQLDVPQSGAAGGNASGVFQVASTDGSRIFFTDSARLTPDATANPEVGERDLYMCSIEEAEGHLACKLSDLSADPEAGRHANVLGAVVAASDDGSSVYFVADGALAPAAIDGTCGNKSAENIAYAEPAGAACDLYRYDAATEKISLVAVLAGRDGHDWGTNLGFHTSRISPNGRWLAFMSQRPLTGYDNRDARTGKRDEEVFVYDAAARSLHCVSCNSTGGRPLGHFISTNTFQGQGPLVDRYPVWAGESIASSIPGWTHVDQKTALYQSRYLSNSGRLFFDSADALVPRDSNGTEDVYQYEPSGVGSCTGQSAGFSPVAGGCVDLISSGTSGEESAFLDASESGDDVFFLTASKLAPTDVDGALDLYDAHVCSATQPCPPPPPSAEPECSGDACQFPAVPPADATPGSLIFRGAGNLIACPKGKVRKAGKCMAKRTKKKKKKAHGKRPHRRTSGHNRGGGK